MKLLIIPSSYPVHDDDMTGVFVRDQARLLARRHDVTVLAPRLVTPRALLRRASHRLAHLSRDLEPGASRLTELSIPILNLTNRWQRLTRRQWRRRMEARAVRLVQTGVVPRPEIVHAHVVHPAGEVALALARRWRAKTVLTEHTGPFAVHLETDALRNATGTAFRAVDAVVAVSPFLADEIRAAFPDLRPAVVGNVVDESFFSPGPAEIPRVPHQPFRLLFVGGLTWHKGAGYLLEVAAALTRTIGRGWQLVIAGDGPDREALEQKARALGLLDHVVFTGSLTRLGVRAWMRSADVLIQPSVVETFCVVLIEAMACGLAVIATDCGGPSWIVRPDCGRLAPPRDVPALTNAVTSAFQADTRLDPHLVRAAAVSRFGRSPWLAAIEQVYASVTAE